MKRGLIFITLLLLISSCEERYPIGAKFFTYDDIPETISLKGERLDIPELQNPSKVHYQNGLLYIADDHGGFKIHVVALDDSLTYLNRLGVEGLGPGEYTDIWKIEDASEKDHIWVQNIQTKKYLKFSAYQDSPIALEEFNQKGDLLNAYELVWSSDNRLIGRPEFAEGKFAQYDSAGTKLSVHGDFKGMLEGNWEELTLSELFNGYNKFNKKSGRLTSAILNADLIEVFNINDNSIMMISGPVNEVNDFDIVYRGQYPMPAIKSGDSNYYYDTHPGENHMFALYLGKKNSEMVNNLEDLSSQIFVFDYEGKPKLRLVLDALVIRMTVDEKNKTIYGVTLEENPSIITYKYDF